MDRSRARAAPGGTGRFTGFFSYPGTDFVASASGTFTMPTFSCARTTDREWLSPDIRVYNSSGALSQFSGAEFNCNIGALFTGSVLCVNSYATGGRVSITGAAAAGHTTVFIGDAGPAIVCGGGVTRVSTFTQLAYVKAQVNAQPVATRRRAATTW